MEKRCTAAVLCLLLLFSLTAFSGCSAKDPGHSDVPQPAEEVPSAPQADADAKPYDETPVSSGEHIVKVTGDVPGGETEIDLELLAAEDPGNTFSGRYSAINNWPSKKFCSASGVRMEAVLGKAGVLDGFRQITVYSTDGYYMSFTREQVLCERYYFPELENDSESGALEAPMMIALAYTSRGAEAEPEPVSAQLVLGQEDVFEHNTPAFVEDIAEIAVSNEDPGKWEPAGSFPSPGAIAAGESVKLQHTYSGLAKMYYTTDGTDPTPYSTMYNPSTYQPEVNVPITVTEDVTIRVLVRGYGKNDSDISELTFSVA
ncbi:MAG: chitobiase/beta-hexosaminidase C-terminal domain-containing protein [Oscillospiraceae bacterium]|nr:chitobiase/beta-hexosaminidase C-terminal domain-containing protein [Oscillospiraceae bacterium]